MPVPKLSVLKRVDKLLEQGEEREVQESKPDKMIVKFHKITFYT